MRDLLSAFVEQIWNQNQPELIEQFIAPEFVVHMLGSDTHGQGIEWVKENVRRTHAHIQHLHITIEDTVVEDAKIASRLLLQGRHNEQTMTMREVMIH